MKKEISSHAGAAKMVRQFMKANGIAGSVISKSYSMGSSISVYVEDLPPAQCQVLKDYVSQFEYGHFDGMQDLYEMSNCRDDIPQVKYAFVNNKISDELYQDIWDFLKSYYSHLNTNKIKNKMFSKMLKKSCRSINDIPFCTNFCRI